MSRDKYIDLINKATQQYNLPVGLLSGVIQRESAFNPLAKSPAGAMGLMQLMPGTAKDLGVTDPFDPEQSIMGGANYLSQQLKAFDNDPKLALAAYNAGPGNVKKYGGIPPFKETQNYVPSVLDAATKFGFGAPAQPEVPPQATQSPIQNLMSQMPEPMGMDQMKSMVGLDDPTLKRQNKMNFIGSILNGLAQVTGSFNPNWGAALQQMYANQNQNNVKLQAAQRESAIANLMKLSEINTTKNPMLTDDIKEYTFAAQNGFKGSFEDWMKQKSSGNPFNQMLALEKLKMDREKNTAQKEKEARGRPLPATQAVLLADGQNIPGMLDKLEQTLSQNTNVGGPFMGRVASMNPYDTQTQNVQSQINASKQLVGKFLEGGVLRKEDESKYDKIMPTMNDTPAVRAAKLKNLRVMIQDKQNEYFDSFSRAGFDVSRYNQEDIPQPPVQQLMSGQKNQENNQNVDMEDLKRRLRERFGE